MNETLSPHTVDWGEEMAQEKKSKKKRSSAAPGQFYGYSVVQGARLLHRLLEAMPEEYVAVEGLDDISTQGGERNIAEQDKSGLAHNPVSDRSSELWKTLFNWLEGIRSGSLSLQTRLVLYVAQEHTGELVERLSACRSSADALQAIAWLRNKYWGEAPHFAFKATNSENLKKYLDPVLEAQDEVLSAMLCQFEFVQGSGAPYEDIKQLLCTKAIGEEAIQPVLDALVGWSQQHVAKCIESKKPPAISQKEFQIQLRAYARKFDRAEKELISAEREITPRELTDQLLSATYIKQLQIIDLGNEDLSDAVVEYLRTKADLTEWAMRGHIVAESHDQYQDELLKAWRRNRSANQIEHAGKSEKTVGQALYFRCIKLRHPLQRMEVPDHFTPGTFHSLANRKALGWHQRFNELLKADELLMSKNHA